MDQSGLSQPRSHYQRLHLQLGSTFTFNLQNPSHNLLVFFLADFESAASLLEQFLNALVFLRMNVDGFGLVMLSGGFVVHESVEELLSRVKKLVLASADGVGVFVEGFFSELG